MADIIYPTIVLDLGSCTTRVGLGTDESPKYCLSLCADTPGQKEPLCSWEALQRSDCTNFRHPVERGVVKDWDDLRSLCLHATRKVAGLKPQDHSFLMSQPPLSSKVSKERFAQIMFEDLNVPYLHLESDDVLSLYSSGRTTGLVLVSGDGVTSISPIQDGFRIDSPVRKLDVVGLDLTLRVQEHLNKQGYCFGGAADQVKIRQVKEALCWVSTLDNNDDAEYNETYELPDGQTVSLGDDAYRIPEMMFTPTDLESVSYPKGVYETILKCDVSMRKDMYKNIILCGGNSLLPGFVDRMDQELEKIVPATSYAKTVKHEFQLDAVWHGGAILASLCSFQSLCMSRAMYEEFGAGLVHRKT